MTQEKVGYNNNNHITSTCFCGIPGLKTKSRLHDVFYFVGFLDTLFCPLSKPLPHSLIFVQGTCVAVL